MTRQPNPGAGCPAHEELKAHVDGELPDGAAQAVEAHLAGCGLCAREVTVMRKINEGIRGLEAAVEPPAGLRDRVLSRISFPADRQGPTWPFQLLQWAAAGGLVMLLVAILFPVFATSRERSHMVAGYPNAKQMVPQMRARGPAAKGGGFGAPGGAAAPAPPSVAGSPARMYAQDQAFGGAPGAGEATPDDVRRYSQGRGGKDPLRKVVQMADLSVRVARRVEIVQDEVADRIKREGGYAEESSLSAPEGADRAVSMTLRIPVARFEATVAYVASLGAVTAKNVRGEDVTGTWLDERASVRDLREEEERLAEAERRATDLEQRQQLRSRLLGLRPRIRRAEEQFAYTSKLAALATIRLSLVEGRHSNAGGSLLWDVQETGRAAVAAFLWAVRVPLALLIWLVVFCPLWLPLALLYRWATRMVRPKRVSEMVAEPQC